MTAAEREKQKQLKQLRDQWRAWKRGWIQDLSHIDYCLLPCAEECGQCECCGSAAYRADRMAEIEAHAKALKATAPVAHVNLLANQQKQTTTESEPRRDPHAHTQ